MSRPLRVLLPALLLLAVAVAVAGCGSNSSSAASAAKATPTPTDPAQEVERIASEISTKVSQRPKIPAPAGRPPADLVEKDIVKGHGPKVQAGDTVSVQYVGASWSDGKEFDASWNRGQAFSLSIPGQVIEGWNEGILGMREGGRRLLVIPPLKGYGAGGTPDGSIKPNETLAFVIDLQQIR
jgi:FKBP-type peptidyl-prolyl cis-trans isomerase